MKEEKVVLQKKLETKLELEAENTRLQGKLETEKSKLSDGLRVSRRSSGRYPHSVTCVVRMSGTILK